MGRMRRYLLIALACIAVFLTHASCSTSNPAGAPTPPLEIPAPAVLKFVEFDQMTTDLSSLTQGATPSVSKLVSPGDDVSDYIRNTVFSIRLYEDELLTPMTKGLGELSIPIADDIQAFEDNVTFLLYSDFLQSSLLGTHNIKLDFRDFDIDDDGMTEGCSGHTAALPICVRSWLDDERYLAWLIQEYPFSEDDPETALDERTIGKGVYKIYLNDVAGVSWEIVIFYEQTLGDAEEKGYDLLLKGTAGDQFSSFGYVFNDYEVKSARNHIAISRDGPEETALKSIDTNYVYDLILDQGIEPLREKNTQRYIEGFDLLAASFFSERLVNDVIEPTHSDQDFCAMISTGIAVEPSECNDVNGQDIRIGFDPLFPEDGHPFISTATDADVAAPADFSETPPADFAQLPKP